MRRITWGVALALTCSACDTKNAADDSKQPASEEPEAKADAKEEKEPLRWKQVTMGETHACALRSDGDVFCWGTDLHVKGDERPVSARLKPTRMEGLDDVKQLVTGKRFTCARTGEGAVKCWGKVSFFVKWESITALASLEGATALAAGDQHLCAVKKGEVWCLGDNDDLQLGHTETKRDWAEPKKVEGLTEVSALGASADTSCAVSKGTIQCWGSDDGGALGDGAPDDPRATPAPVKSLPSMATVTGGGDTFCATETDGSVHCWGGSVGALIDDLEAEKGVPHRIAKVKYATEVVITRDTACARTTEGKVLCWGSERDGGLARGFVLGFPKKHPAEPMKGLDGAIDVASNDKAICALVDDGARLACWGSGRGGALSTSAFFIHRTPVEVKGLAKVTSVATGWDFSCAADESGTMKCWGEGAAAVGWGGDHELQHRIHEPEARGTIAPQLHSLGKLVGGLREGRLHIVAGGRTHLIPTAREALPVWRESVVEGLDELTDVISLRRDFVARRKDGSLVAFTIEREEDEDGKTTRKATPRPIAGAPRGSAIAGEGEAICVLGAKADRRVSCFVVDQSGDEPTGAVTVTAHDVPDTRGASQIAVCDDVGCVVTKEGKVGCFGVDDEEVTPAKLVEGLEDVKQVAVGGTFGHHRAAVTRSGKLYTWSSSSQDLYGLSAQDSLIAPTSPTLVAGVADAEEVSMHDEQACVRHTSGKVSCWGNNGHEEVGASTPPILYQPTTIELPTED